MKHLILILILLNVASLSICGQNVYIAQKEKDADYLSSFVREVFVCSQASDIVYYYISDVKRNYGKNRLNQFTIKGKTTGGKVRTIASYCEKESPDIIQFRNKAGYAILDWGKLNDGFQIYVPDVKADAGVKLTKEIFNLSHAPTISYVMHQIVKEDAPFNYNDYFTHRSSFFRLFGMEKPDYEKIRSVSSNPSMADIACDLLYHYKRLAYNKQCIFGYCNCYTNGFSYVNNGEGIVLKNNMNLVMGQENPVIYGEELNKVVGTWFSMYQGKTKETRKTSLIAEIKQAWQDFKGVCCFSWHMENPYVPSTFAKTTDQACRYRYASIGYPQKHRYVIREILNGTGEECGLGSYSGKGNDQLYANPKAWFIAAVKEVANLLSELKDDKGNYIPVIIRLPHEMEDDWHWWGPSSATTDEYKAFCRLIVRSLHELTSNNAVLFAYSPDRYAVDAGHYLKWYPGDNYIDILGYDDYGIYNETIEDAIERARTVSRTADAKYKPAMLFESSIQNNGNNWFFNSMMRVIKDEEVNLSAFLLWTNWYVCHKENGAVESDFAALHEMLQLKDIVTNKNISELMMPK